MVSFINTKKAYLFVYLGQRCELFLHWSLVLPLHLGWQISTSWGRICFYKTWTDNTAWYKHRTTWIADYKRYVSFFIFFLIIVCLHILTKIWLSRHVHLAVCTVFDVESDSGVESSQILQGNKKNRIQNFYLF